MITDDRQDQTTFTQPTVWSPSHSAGQTPSSGLATAVIKIRRASAQWLKRPLPLYVLAAALLLGAPALNAALGHWLNQPNRDLWQHTAALRALIANIQHPTNPFVNTSEPSRHFQPYWVVTAWIAREFGLSVSVAIGLAGFFCAAIVALGFFTFGRSFYRSNWGPLALLLSSILAWSIPISHTGFLNIPTLVEGASYPAVLLVGLSLVLWALVIESLERLSITALIPPLAALMFTTHPLGAGLGFIVASCFALAWPDGTHLRRLAVLSAIALGIAISSFWIYFKPIDSVLRAGNPTWDNGVDFYNARNLVGIFVPSALGIFGLLRPTRAGISRPLLLALPILLAGFLVGDLGFPIGSRFAPTAAMVLQIGIGMLLVRCFESPQQQSERFKLFLAASAFGTVVFQAVLLGVFLYPKEHRDEMKYGSVLRAADALSADLPDNQEVAAYDVAAWPLVAVGQKVLSVPWPEPFIHDLPQRQIENRELFDVRLSRDQRIALARQVHVRTLILDERWGQTTPWRAAQLGIFKSQSRHFLRAGPMWRFDLY